MTKRQLISLHNLTSEILAGLDGKPFHWGMGKKNSMAPLLTRLDVSLVTRTQIAKLGYKLKRSQTPVGSVYFGAPICKDAEVFVLEIQCVKISD